MRKNPKNKKSTAGSYGQELILDLYECNPEIIRSRKKLREFTDQLCRLIKMKKFGRTLIPHFGHNKPKTAGYSLVQLIETSSLTGHFSELWNSAYINIFSCQSFDARKAVQFTQKFFQAKKVKNRVIIRN